MSYKRYNSQDDGVGAMFIGLLFIVGLIVIIGLVLAGGLNYSHGERHGVVNKLSYKGIFCKTWEGEMNLGGFRNVTNKDSDGNTTTSVVANLFEFSVKDEAVVQKIQAAMDEGRPIGLVYDQILFRNPCAASTSYNIVEVRE